MALYPRRYISLFTNNLLIKEVSGQSLSITDSIQYINQQVPCPRNNDADHVNVVLNSFNEEVKMYLSVDSVD
jgi:hypothetical protein